MTTEFIFPEPTVEELQRVLAHIMHSRYIVRPISGRGYLETDIPQPGDTIVFDRKKHSGS